MLRHTKFTKKYMNYFLALYFALSISCSVPENDSVRIRQPHKLQKNPSYLDMISGSETFINLLYLYSETAIRALQTLIPLMSDLIKMSAITSLYCLTVTLHRNTYNKFQLLMFN